MFKNSYKLEFIYIQSHHKKGKSILLEQRRRQVGGLALASLLPSFVYGFGFASWLRWLAVDHLAWSPGSIPGPGYVGFVMDKAALSQVSPTSVFRCQYHFVDAPCSFIRHPHYIKSASDSVFNLLTLKSPN